MKKIVIIVVTLFMLVGCDNKKVESVTYQKLSDGFKITTTLDHTGDRVLKNSTVSDMQYKFLGVDKETLNFQIERYKKMYDVDGVTYTVEFKDDGIIEKMDIDYEKADLNTLVSIGLLASTQKDGKILFVGLEQCVKNLEATGLTKVQK